MITHIAALIEDELQLSPIEIEIDKKTKDLSLTISIEHLFMVLLEICYNSVKFHPTAKPQLIIKLSADTNNQLRLSILDHGRHVADEALKMLISPYYQDERDVSGDIPGMELGLSRVVSLISTYGGSCEVQNREDQTGLCVRLDLPALIKNDRGN